MPHANEYNPQKDFSDAAQNNEPARSTVDAVALDAELRSVSTSVNRIIENQKLLQRDDGNLIDASVKINTLSREVLMLIGGYTLRGNWARDTQYNKSDVVAHGSLLYFCSTPHTSSSEFAPESPNWIAFGVYDGSIDYDKPFVLAIVGQSNACGARAGGKNPASDMVKTWDGDRGVWGSSDYTQTPWVDSSPNGNMGNNNVALALAHRIAEEKGRPVYIIYDAVGGRPIEDWMGTGTTSVRWASLQSKIDAALASPELASRGVTHVDAVVWAQGEENALTDSVSAYSWKFKALITQFRSDAWMENETPILVMGMSNLHTRYYVGWAQMAFCENIDRNCIYVNSAGLKTQWDVDGTGDATHFLGSSLWEAGYHRAWYAFKNRAFTHRGDGVPMAYGRSTGRWSGENTAILAYSGMSSWNSKTSEFPTDGVVGLDSISWGWLCGAVGRYSLAGGYTCTVDAAGRYNNVWGRDLIASASANYSGAFGYQNQLNSNYGFATGRGHTVSDDGGSAFGTFSKYKTPQTNKVLAQIGIGTSSSVAKNALTVRGSGLIEHFIGAAEDPEQKQEMVFQLIDNFTLKIKVKGTDSIVRSTTLMLT